MQRGEGRVVEFLIFALFAHFLTRRFGAHYLHFGYKNRGVTSWQSCSKALACLWLLSGRRRTGLATFGHLHVDCARGQSRV
jgi:hypothetical protein